MKKTFFVCVLLLATAFVAFSQKYPRAKGQVHSNQEVVDMLKNALEFNGAVVLTDLNNAKVGQTATFPLQNGGTKVYVIKYKETFWMLGDSAITYNEQHPENSIVKHSERNKGNDADSTKAGVLPPVIAQNGFNWTALFIALAALVLLALIAFRKRIADWYEKMRKKMEERQKARQELIPLVDGGVNDAQAPAYMQSVARRKNYTITGPTERILLTTVRPITMDYYGGVTQPEEFTNEPFFQAPARRNDNGQACFARFRQTCGNDGTVLNESDVIITRITEQSAEIRQANTAVGTPMTATTQSAQPVTESTFMKLARIVDESLEAKHEVTFTVTNAEIQLNLKDAVFSVNHVDLVKKDHPAEQIS